MIRASYEGWHTDRVQLLNIPFHGIDTSVEIVIVLLPSIAGRYRSSLGKVQLSDHREMVPASIAYLANKCR